MDEWPLRYKVADCGPGCLGNTIRIKSIEPRNLGWTISPKRRKLLFMANFNDIQFQTILQDIADDTVVPLGAVNQQNLQNNRVRITKNCEWPEDK